MVQRTPPEPLQRWSALFHDMGKPAAAFFEETDEGPVEHFYGHAVISTQLACDIMHRLPFPAWLRRDVPPLVRAHDDVVPPNARAVRRMLGRLGGRTDLFAALCDIKRPTPWPRRRSALPEPIPPTSCAPLWSRFWKMRPHSP